MINSLDNLIIFFPELIIAHSSIKVHELFIEIARLHYITIFFFNSLSYSGNLFDWAFLVSLSYHASNKIGHIATS